MSKNAPTAETAKLVEFLKDHQLDGVEVKKGEKRKLPAAYAEHLAELKIVAIATS
jgi:predicted metal-dependent phosphoesterase TrpH